MTDRFIKFLQVELNDWLGKYNNEKDASAKEDNIFNQIYDFFAGNEAQNEEKKQEKEKTYQEYRRNRQSQNRNYTSNHTQSVNEEKKYYDALEIRQGATFEEIKNAYKAVMKKYHPDRFASDPQKQTYAIQLSQKINEAYEYFKKKFGK